MSGWKRWAMAIGTGLFVCALWPMLRDGANWPYLAALNLVGYTVAGLLTAVLHARLESRGKLAIVFRIILLVGLVVLLIDGLRNLGWSLFGLHRADVFMPTYMGMYVTGILWFPSYFGLSSTPSEPPA